VTTVREAAFELFREHGVTTIFGNPGSTELPMLGSLPGDFRYVPGLHEMVAVGMADGYAQATGSVAHVNLHTAPGLGNGLGTLFNARANKSPLLVTAGQHARSLITMQANLTNYDAVNVPRPFVKWSFEPPRAEDVPASLGRAIAPARRPRIRVDPHRRLECRGTTRQLRAADPATRGWRAPTSAAAIVGDAPGRSRIHDMMPSPSHAPGYSDGGDALDGRVCIYSSTPRGETLSRPR
jgi:Thiamine pyrophosphate enzyme, N-terminal TPP binding domain